MNSSQTWVLLMWSCYNPYHSMWYTPCWSMNQLSHVLKYQSILCVTYTIMNKCCHTYSVVFCCTILYLCEYIHISYSKLYSCLCQAQDYNPCIVILENQSFPIIWPSQSHTYLALVTYIELFDLQMC
jgi:hypothetical protein